MPPRAACSSPGSDSNPKEFNEALIGANVDDVKTVTWTDEVEEGEEAETHTVEVTVKGIKVRNNPRAHRRAR